MSYRRNYYQKQIFTQNDLDNAYFAGMQDSSQIAKKTGRGETASAAIFHAMMSKENLIQLQNEVRPDFGENDRKPLRIEIKDGISIPMKPEQCGNGNIRRFFGFFIPVLILAGVILL